MRSRIAAALAEAAKTPIDPARLDAIKSHLRYAFAGSLRTADAVADAVGTAVATTGRPESINELYAAYDRLTPADLQRVAAKYFQPEQRDGHHPRDGDQEMTTRQLHGPLGGTDSARGRRDLRFAVVLRGPRSARTAVDSRTADALAARRPTRWSRSESCSAPARKATRRARRAWPP